jgi:hypothetical protein
VLYAVAKLCARPHLVCGADVTDGLDCADHESDEEGEYRRAVEPDLECLHPQERDGVRRVDLRVGDVGVANVAHALLRHPGGKGTPFMFGNIGQMTVPTPPLCGNFGLVTVAMRKFGQVTVLSTALVDGYLTAKTFVYLSN